MPKGCISPARVRRPGLKCVACRNPFCLDVRSDFAWDVAVDDPVAALRALAEPFLAQCPLCDHEAAYPKSAIKMLRVVGPA